MATSIKLLIVEDETKFAKRLMTGLQELGCDSDHVKTKDEALYQVANQNYDIVLMDINLKGEEGKHENTDGIDAAEHITRDYQIPIVFLTTAGTLWHEGTRWSITTVPSSCFKLHLASSNECASGDN